MLHDLIFAANCRVFQCHKSHIAKNWIFALHFVAGSMGLTSTTVM